MKTRMLSGSILMLCALSTALGQEIPGFAPAGKEHAWLEQFVGEWDAKAKASAGPNQPETECSGTAKFKKLGDFWIVGDVHNEVADFKIQAIQTIGYDPASKKYVGSWVDSMTSHLWKYEGSVDETGKTLTLEAEGPNPLEPGKMAKYRDIYEFKSKDHIVSKSEALGPNGEWITFMTGELTRKK